MASDSQQRNIVIVGGGIIGCVSAYFITRHPSYNPWIHSVTILEATGIACGASGKAGGLLASWAYPACIVPLSFRLHEELAIEHDGAQRWGYRKIHCGSLGAKLQVQAESQKEVKGEDKEKWAKLSKVEGKQLKQMEGPALPTDLDWINLDVITGYEEMGDPTTTAQVHPYQFTTSMASLAQEKGTSIIFGAVKSINHANNQVISISYEDKSTKESCNIKATDVILAAGPWTSQVFPQAPITALRAHSITLKATVSPHALFTDISFPQDTSRNARTGTCQRNTTVSPEIYPRPNNEVYACGEGDSSVPLPASADMARVDERRCQDIIDHVSAISPVLAGAEVLVMQACYLPCVGTDGGPLVGPTGMGGHLLAAGHSCWGIQNSCATGKIISEFLWEGRASSADVASLDPRRVLGKLGV